MHVCLCACVCLCVCVCACVCVNTSLFAFLAPLSLLTPPPANLAGIGKILLDPLVSLARVFHEGGVVVVRFRLLHLNDAMQLHRRRWQMAKKGEGEGV